VICSSVAGWTTRRRRRRRRRPFPGWGEVPHAVKLELPTEVSFALLLPCVLAMGELPPPPPPATARRRRG